jgi:hypothetical protein
MFHMNQARSPLKTPLLARWMALISALSFAAASLTGNDPPDFSDRMLTLGAELRAKAGDRWSMLANQGGPNAGMGPGPDDLFGPFGMGAKRSWVPALGEIVWQIPKPLEARAYYAYVARLDDGRQIGYVRIPNYKTSRDAVEIFKNIVDRFEKTTSAMILDEVENPGGDMFQMYALLSSLTDRPLSLPTHQITIDEDYAALAAEIVARGAKGGPPEKRPSSELLGYARFVLAEKAAGRGTASHLTNPVYLEGVSKIVPSKPHYTKKIVVLTNEGTGSAAEFLAAILQDNGRAAMFGRQTAGAGSCVKRVELHGGLVFTYSWTVGRRTNGELIEDKGVMPDATYETTVDDLVNGYSGFRIALLAFLDRQLLSEAKRVKKK